MGEGLTIDLKVVNDFATEIGNLNTLLQKEFQTLDQAMKTLGNVWQDDVGSAYMAQFSSFIKKSKEINNDLSKLKGDITSRTSYYAQVLKAALSAWG